MRKYMLFLVFLGVLSLALVITSITLMGTPVSQKAVNLDKQRLNDLSTIRSQIQDYYRTNNRLPTTLAELQTNTYYRVLNTTDPETMQPYEYKVVTNTSYQLCTTFSTDGTMLDEYTLPYRDYDSYQTGTIQKGYSCLTYRIPNYMISPSPSPTPYTILTPSVTPYTTITPLLTPQVMMER